MNFFITLDFIPILEKNSRFLSNNYIQTLSPLHVLMLALNVPLYYPVFVKL